MWQIKTPHDHSEISHQKKNIGELYRRYPLTEPYTYSAEGIARVQLVGQIKNPPPSGLSHK